MRPSDAYGNQGKHKVVTLNAKAAVVKAKAQAFKTKTKTVNFSVLTKSVLEMMSISFLGWKLNQSMNQAMVDRCRRQ